MTIIRTTTHPLAGPTGLEDFMATLEARRDAYYADRPHIWAKYPVADFYMPEDDAWIIPPAPTGTAPAARKPKRGPEYHQRLLNAAETRLAKARERAEQAQARGNQAGLPDDPGAHSGITHSTHAGRKHADRTENARHAASLAAQKVRRLEHICATHRARLTQALERTTT